MKLSLTCCWSSLSSSQDDSATSETPSWLLPAGMETLNIDAVIIQGHVDTQASVCKIAISFDVN